jgi:uncharacterized protein
VGKILFLFVIGWAVYAILKNYKRSISPASQSREKPVEDMVRCAHCSVNLPRSEALYTGGQFFCTPEHQKIGKK